MSSSFCFPGSVLLRSVICRKKLHAARLPAAEDLHVKTEFYQKSQPHFLRFFGLTFHNIRRKSRPAGILPGKRNRVFKELSTFPTDFSTSIFSLFFNTFCKISRKCQSRKRYFVLFRLSLCSFHNTISPRDMQGKLHPDANPAEGHAPSAGLSFSVIS